MVEKANILLDNLSSILAGPVREEFADLFRQARMRTKDEEMILPNFQDVLEDALKGRAHEADEALLARVIRAGRCPWIGNLVAEVIEENARVMGRQADGGDVKMEAFLRECVLLVGRQVYRNPIMMYDRFKRSERERNRAQMDAMIRTAVGQCATYFAGGVSGLEADKDECDAEVEPQGDVEAAEAAESINDEAAPDDDDIIDEDDDASVIAEEDDDDDGDVSVISLS